MIIRLNVGDQMTRHGEITSRTIDQILQNPILYLFTLFSTVRTNFYLLSFAPIFFLHETWYTAIISFYE